MTEEEKKERKREYCRKHYANLTPEQKEERRLRQKQNRLKRETARLNLKCKEKQGTSKKESPRERRKRYARENAEALALGISYGKYQMLKENGMLPEHIEIPEHEKPKKMGVYEPAPKGFKEFNEFKERQVARVAAEITEERRQTRAIVRGGDRAARSYMERMKKQREAIERARVSRKD